MADTHLKKIVARTSAVACLLAIAALLLSLVASKHTPPLRYAVNCLITIGAGYNMYFLFNWLRSLTQPKGRWITVFVGVAWLAVSAAIYFAVVVLGYAEGAGGGSESPPSAADWYGGLAILGVGVVFNWLLHWIRLFLGDPIRSR